MLVPVDAGRLGPGQAPEGEDPVEAPRLAAGRGPRAAGARETQRVQLPGRDPPPGVHRLRPGRRGRQRLQLRHHDQHPRVDHGHLRLALEEQPGLAATARANLAGQANVEVVQGRLTTSELMEAFVSRDTKAELS